jgi:hypothetical protein
MGDPIRLYCDGRSIVRIQWRDAVESAVGIEGIWKSMTEQCTPLNAGWGRRDKKQQGDGSVATNITILFKSTGSYT